jgi:hypothetical protein
VNTFAVFMIAVRLIHARSVATRPSCFVVRPQQSKGRFLSSLNLLRLAIPTSEDMEDVGAILSMGTGPGDVILLGGDLGAGKTCFSRGFVRARTGDMDQRVTSPTYLLSNTYDAGDVLYEIYQQITPFWSRIAQSNMMSMLFVPSGFIIWIYIDCREMNRIYHL